MKLVLESKKEEGTSKVPIKRENKKAPAAAPIRIHIRFSVEIVSGLFFRRKL